MAEFESDPNNAYGSVDEYIHGVGAHEEMHLDPQNIKESQNEDRYKAAYDSEKPAFEAEIKARTDFKKENN